MITVDKFWSKINYIFWCSEDLENQESRINELIQENSHLKHSYQVKLILLIIYVWCIFKMADAGLITKDETNDDEHGRN